MDKKTNELIQETVKTVMGIDISDLDKSTKINTISEWDSFNNLMLISRFQEILKVEFSITEIDAVVQLGDLFTLIEKHTK